MGGTVTVTRMFEGRQCWPLDPFAAMAPEQRPARPRSHDLPTAARPVQSATQWVTTILDGIHEANPSAQVVGFGYDIMFGGLGELCVTAGSLAHVQGAGLVRWLTHHHCSRTL